MHSAGESGLSKDRYCRVHGLSPNRFGYWAKKYPPEGPVDVAPPALVLLPFILAPKAPSIGLLAGMNGYLSKPVNLEDLRQAIETMIKHQ